MLEKSTEANLDSHLNKLKDDLSSNYLTKIDFNDKYNELNGKLDTAENLQKNLAAKYITKTNFDEKYKVIEGKINLVEREIKSNYFTKNELSERFHDINGKMSLLMNLQKTVGNIGTVNNFL